MLRVHFIKPLKNIFILKKKLKNKEEERKKNAFCKEITVESESCSSFFPHHFPSSFFFDITGLGFSKTLFSSSLRLHSTGKKGFSVRFGFLSLWDVFFFFFFSLQFSDQMEFPSEVSLLRGAVLVAKRRSIGGFGRIRSPSPEGIVLRPRRRTLHMDLCRRRWLWLLLLVRRPLQRKLPGGRRQRHRKRRQPRQRNLSPVHRFLSIPPLRIRSSANVQR